MAPTRQDIIEDLQNRIYKNHITDINELEEAIKQTGLDLDLYDDVLAPMGYNTCDRCGDLADTEVGLFWLDGFDWEDGNPTDQKILNALNKEQADYSAICYKCLNELKGE